METGPRHRKTRQMVILHAWTGARPNAPAGAPQVGSGARRLMWHQIEEVRHPAELGKRTSLHLPHQVGAMHLHRRFGDTDIVGNLLVQATGHHMEHDLSLAGTERVETLSEPSQGLITLPSGSIARDSRLD